MVHLGIVNETDPANTAKNAGWMWRLTSPREKAAGSRRKCKKTIFRVLDDLNAWKRAWWRK